ncbi:MAG: DUF1772 domain-containing protein [Gammaproteobacteria bacterium]|nr:DUF1772 domain-containing protein [Gammaproteobacteria bacterium]
MLSACLPAPFSLTSPLNNLLARLDPNSARAHQVWSRYLKTWKNWNHLRTVSSLVTCILCIWLLSNY